jgi:pyrimidine operon attenuation protein / uracil phosphoribosyltransferase
MPIAVVPFRKRTGLVHLKGSFGNDLLSHKTSIVKPGLRPHWKSAMPNASIRQMDFVEKARIMDGPRINRALARLASEIVEENHGADDLYLVGIRRRGVPLAERMADKIADLEGDRPPVGVLDITLYRDDLSMVGAKPVVNRTDLPGDIANRNIVLIDDVLYTGRTIRAAMDQLIDFGRPRRVQLAVLIDRGKEHREVPIQADYIGKLVPTKKSEIIKVMLKEFDEEEGVAIVERPSSETG